jgi:formylglycine-generating enzyme required for sulfatase activity
VTRGGCWADDAKDCRSARRFPDDPTAARERTGFRVVCELR